jgi:NAD(P)-dependent dehydrogenase (short-subunit alcohol dehydrogenase family)
MPTVLITGANSGLGLFLARTMARDGYHVVVGCRSQAKVDEAIKAVKEGGGAEEVSGMVTDLGHNYDELRASVSSYSG